MLLGWVLTVKVDPSPSRLLGARVPPCAWAASGDGETEAVSGGRPPGIPQCDRSGRGMALPF